MTSEITYTNNASVVVLAAFALIEATSILGASSSLVSVFVHPLNLVVSVVLVSFSLLGMYGILKDSRTATYFSLLTPVVETMVCISFFVFAFIEANIKPMLLLTGLQILLFGILGIFLASKALSQSALLWVKTDISGKDAEAATDGYAVEVIDATKKYTAGSVVVPAVNGLTMRVRRGEFVAVNPIFTPQTFALTWLLCLILSVISGFYPACEHLS